MGEFTSCMEKIIITLLLLLFIIGCAGQNNNVDAQKGNQLEIAESVISFVEKHFDAELKEIYYSKIPQLCVVQGTLPRKNLIYFVDGNIRIQEIIKSEVYTASINWFITKDGSVYFFTEDIGEIDKKPFIGTQPITMSKLSESGEFEGIKSNKETTTQSPSSVVIEFYKKINCTVEQTRLFLPF